MTMDEPDVDLLEVIGDQLVDQFGDAFARG